ncbi:MAG: 3-hydroxyacyl-CoA dehydrogenase/enoyl-CoA hydratase family protein [Phycisphaerales bacterium]|nr:3-hydroxyacyl-CoA dehydrogenase/enoyl-CoA hydratase family protein [Phycisphaerales bacterium]
MKNRNITKVAVLGSGIMGSRIACHFANIGVEVLLLDMLTKGTEESTKPAERNKLVNDALQFALKSSPSPIYSKESVKLISTGNFKDDLSKISSCDWIVEVVIEMIDIKRSIFAEVEKYRKPGTLVTSNTSGLPIHELSRDCSDDFKKHFCGTHFFNPPRYLRLLEVIPTPSTDKDVVDFLMNYGELYLGKKTVLCKDTPAFIANRVGVYSMMSIMNIMDKLGLTVDEIDSLTGPIIGRPKSATFRTADVVGLETLIKVSKDIALNCPNDEAKSILANVPAYITKMIENKWLGDKTGQGFFKKVKSEKGKEILTLNLKTFEYAPRVKSKFATLEQVKMLGDLPLTKKLKAVCKGTDKAGDFYRQFHYSLFSYISFRIPEISDNLYSVDDALMAGFGWEIGAFESWDALGVVNTLEAMKKEGYKVASWVEDMVKKGITSFYKVEKSKKLCYNQASQSYKPIGGNESFIYLKNYTESLVWKNDSCSLYEIGDDVVALEWNTKMNTIGHDVIEGIQQSVKIAEDRFKGLVIANDGANFSAGANIATIFMFAAEGDYDELNIAIRQFQQGMLCVRYSSIPVVVAPHGLVLGGGCELTMHADKVCASAESYMGLVELGIGVIPAGGGTTEFIVRACDDLHFEEPETITLKNRFLTIAQAKVSTSATEAFELGILRKGIDRVIVNGQRRILEAKNTVLDLHNTGYVRPVKRKDIKVFGKLGLGALYAGINGMLQAGYATEHDALVARKLAQVFCGGELSEPTLVSEDYLLDIEREVFLSLCGERKTLQRMESVIKTGKPIRN